MKKLYISLVLALLFVHARAQTVPSTQSFGKVDKADLELKSCNFEPDANAMVLFDKGVISFDEGIVKEQHKRIKIFNDQGKRHADIRIVYNSFGYISGFEAHTINVVNGEIQKIKVDSKQIFKQKVDKWQSATIFTFPEVKPGSIIEYRYTLMTRGFGNLPPWFFQNIIPTRYSEVTTKIPDLLYFRTQARIRQPLSKNKSTSESKGNMLIEIDTRALDNVHSLPTEPFMGSALDNLQSIFFVFTGYKGPRASANEVYNNTWAKIGAALDKDVDFGLQLNKHLGDEKAIIDEAKKLPTDDAKIAFIFNKVKSCMQWDKTDDWYTIDGTVKAWEKKVGNSTELNLIVYHMLKEAGVNACPMIVSTRENGKVFAYNAFLYQFNRTVVYIPVDSTKHYVLDATNKYNQYNQVPDDLLNSSGLYINHEDKKYDLVLLENNQPVRQAFFINGEIKADGKLTGTTKISSFGYNKVAVMSKYKTDGEEKYLEAFKKNTDNIKISSAKFDNMDIDSLPLVETIAFEQELTGSDDNYIYFNPNILTALKTNPFLSENRFTDVDYSYRRNFIIAGTYKIPDGYAVESLPQTLNLTMPDKSIAFRRIVSQNGHVITIRYAIDHLTGIYYRDDYADFREFNRQMYEKLNEQIVLKKS